MIKYDWSGQQRRRVELTFFVGGAISRLKESSTLIARSMEYHLKAPSSMARVRRGSRSCKLKSNALNQSFHS